MGREGDRALRGRLALVVALLTFTTACGTTAANGPSPSPSPIPSAVPMPSPAANPAYPPATLADLVGLANKGVARRFIGMEGQSLAPACNRAWMRVYEPPGVAPEQMAADLLKVSIARHALQKSCGGMVFGTMDASYCNCYHAEHGYLEIDRGPTVEPAPGKMLVWFALTDKTPALWQVVVDAPAG